MMALVGLRATNSIRELRIQLNKLPAMRACLRTSRDIHWRTGTGFTTSWILGCRIILSCWWLAETVTPFLERSRLGRWTWITGLKLDLPSRPRNKDGGLLFKRVAMWLNP